VSMSNMTTLLSVSLQITFKINARKTTTTQTPLISLHKWHLLWGYGQNILQILN